MGTIRLWNNGEAPSPLFADDEPTAKVRLRVGTGEKGPSASLPSSARPATYHQSTTRTASSGCLASGTFLTSPQTGWVNGIIRRFNAVAAKFSATNSRPKTLDDLLADIARGDRGATIAAAELIRHLPRGNHIAILGELKRVSKRAPGEAKLLARELFARSDPHGRCDLIHAAVTGTPELADRQTLEEWFIGLMSASTREERRAFIYPKLLNLAEAPSPEAKEAQFLRGWLIAILQGWLQEAHEVADVRQLVERTERIFDRSLTPPKSSPARKFS